MTKQNLIQKRRCIRFAITFDFLEDFIMFFKERQTKVALGYLDKL